MSIYAGLSSGGGEDAFERSESAAESGTGALSRTCRVVIGDPHPLVLEGLAYLLRGESAVDVVERCTTGASLLDSIRHHRPDVSLVDIRLQEPDGLEVLRSIKKEALQTAVIAMCESMQDDQVLEVMRLGIRGLVLKSAPIQTVIGCLRAVRSGGTCLDQPLVERAMVSMLTRETALRELGSVLTGKELEVVRMVGLGVQNRQISERLFVSAGTLKVHLHHIYEKLRLASRDDLINYLKAKGL